MLTLGVLPTYSHIHGHAHAHALAPYTTHGARAPTPVPTCRAPTGIKVKMWMIRHGCADPTQPLAYNRVELRARVLFPHRIEVRGTSEAPTLAPVFTTAVMLPRDERGGDEVAVRYQHGSFSSSLAGALVRRPDTSMCWRIGGDAGDDGFSRVNLHTLHRREQRTPAIVRASLLRKADPKLVSAANVAFGTHWRPSDQCSDTFLRLAVPSAGQYLTLPYLTLPYLTLPYLILPTRAVLPSTLPYLTLPYHADPCSAAKCLTLPTRAAQPSVLPYRTLQYLTLHHLAEPSASKSVDPTAPCLALPYINLPRRPQASRSTGSSRWLANPPRGTRSWRRHAVGRSAGRRSASGCATHAPPQMPHT